MSCLIEVVDFVDFEAVLACQSTLKNGLIGKKRRERLKKRRKGEERAGGCRRKVSIVAMGRESDTAGFT